MGATLCFSPNKIETLEITRDLLLQRINSNEALSDDEKMT